MINLFRKIRFENMGKNKKSSYLKYAIGEIALVVVGILIALQINNWNEEHTDRLNEQHLLTSLNEEFVLNRNELKNTEIRLTEKIKTISKLLDLFGQNANNVRKEYLDSLLYLSFDSPSIKMSTDVFSSIFSTGKMDLITNPKLKDLLLSWGSTLSEYKKIEENSYLYLNKNVVPRMEDQMSFKNIEQYGSIKGISNSKILSDNRVILKDLSAENLFFNLMWELKFVHNYYPRIDSIMNEIIVVIDETYL